MGDNADAVDGRVRNNDGKKLLWAIENVRAEFGEAPKLWFRSNGGEGTSRLSIGRLRHAFVEPLVLGELVFPFVVRTRARYD